MGPIARLALDKVRARHTPPETVRLRAVGKAGYLRVAGEAVDGPHDTWKRGLDLALGTTAFVCFAPLVAMVAVVIKLTSKGPVFVTQERIGLNRRVTDRRSASNGVPQTERRRNGDRRIAYRHGKPFKMYKFRSMRENAEGAEPVWAVESDPRITPVGRVLRRTRIDEIPQFLNVLRGDMSIVGPRPEREFFYVQLKKEIPDFPRRLRAKPGITGLAQVNNGYTNTVEGTRIKLRHDLEYIENLRPSADAKILFKTVSVVVTGKGAC